MILRGINLSEAINKGQLHIGNKSRTKFRGFASGLTKGKLPFIGFVWAPLWSTSTNFPIFIRESVDSLYRDDAGEISRDPRTKRLKTRRE